MNFSQGEIIAIDKPYHWSSFGIVAKLRWLLTQRLGHKVKVGHAGTLDPLATGVLLLCTGRATKRIEELQQLEKEYVATLRLGATTASFDMEHPVEQTFPVGHITPQAVEQTLRQFEGDIMQTPPQYSACKVDGKRAYEYTRRGENVVISAKPIHIERIELTACQLPDITIRVTCGKGTYIRALARDIGTALQSGAYLTSLRRTRAGGYTEADCIQFADLPQWVESVPIDEPIDTPQQ